MIPRTNHNGEDDNNDDDDDVSECINQKAIFHSTTV